MTWQTRDKSRPINTYEERLPNELRDQLYAYLREPRAVSSAEENRERLQAVNTFLTRYTLAIDNSQLRFITLSEVLDILRFAGMTLAEAYAVWGVSLTWDTPETEVFYHALTTLEEETTKTPLRHLYTFSMNCVAPFFQNPEMTTAMPSSRLMIYRKRRYSKTDRLGLRIDPDTGDVIRGIDEQLCEITQTDTLSAWEDRHYRSKIPLKNFPACANLFHLSLKWIWCMGDEDLCWDHSPIIDNIMSNYLLSSLESRDALRTLALHFAAHSDC